MVAEVMTETPAGSARDHLAQSQDVFVYSDETCRSVAEDMATIGVMNMPVLDRESGQVCGHISARELLIGRRRAFVRESKRTIAFRSESRKAS
jgi:predicted transcriptional regulator